MFYDNFIYLCRQKKISPSAAAIQAGLSKSSVSKWKSGVLPGAAALQKLSNYFNVNVDVLLLGIIADDFLYEPVQKTFNIPVDHDEFKEDFDEEESDLLLMYRSMSESGRERLLAYAQDLISSGNYRKKEEADTSSA